MSTTTLSQQWVDPRIVLSPLAGIRDLRIIQDGRDNFPEGDPRRGNSVAVMTYYGNKNAVGHRWDEGKLGFPNAYGRPMWHILPDHLAPIVVATVEEMDRTITKPAVPLELRLMRLEEGLAVVRELWSGTPASLLDRVEVLERRVVALMGGR